jgi:hypothetical protein
LNEKNNHNNLPRNRSTHLESRAPELSELDDDDVVDHDKPLSMARSIVHQIILLIQAKQFACRQTYVPT